MNCARHTNQQEQIGQNMIWRGLLTQKFGDIQEATYRLHGFPKEKTGTSWARMIVGRFEIVWEELSSTIHKDSIQGQKNTYKKKSKIY